MSVNRDELDNQLHSECVHGVENENEYEYGSDFYVEQYYTSDNNQPMAMLPRR